MVGASSAKCARVRGVPPVAPQNPARSGGGRARELVEDGRAAVSPPRVRARPREVSPPVSMARQQGP